jgi:hypothetical protein
MGSGGIAPPFLTSARDGGEFRTSRNGRFAPGDRAPGIHWVGDWVDPRAGLDAMEERRYFAPAGNRTPDVQLVA